MQECSWVRDEMKCRFCGGIVNLTDSVCPHCGKEIRSEWGKSKLFIRTVSAV